MLTHLIMAAMGGGISTPGAPNLLGLDNGSSCTSCSSSYSVTITWVNDDPSQETRIYRNGALLHTAAAGETEYEDTSGSVDTTVTYELRHWDGLLESAGDSRSIVVVDPCITPSAPTGTATALSETEIEIDVDDQANVTEWRVFREGTNVLVGVITDPAVPIVDSGRSPGTLYEYELRATSTTGCFSTRTTISASTLSAALDPPTVAVTALSTTEIEIDVDAQADADQWEVHRNGNLVGTITDPAVPITDSGLSPGTAYTYSVVAQDTDGPRPDSATTQEPGYTDLAAPTASVMVVSSTEIQIDVDAQDGADQWNVYRAGTATLVGTITNPSSPLVDPGLTPNTLYEYDVEAVDSQGNHATSAKTTTSGTTQRGTATISSLSLPNCPTAADEVLITLDLDGNTTDDIIIERWLLDGSEDENYVPISGSPFAGGTTSVTDSSPGPAGEVVVYRVSFDYVGSATRISSIDLTC